MYVFVCPHANSSVCAREAVCLSINMYVSVCLRAHSFVCMCYLVDQLLKGL